MRRVFDVLCAAAGLIVLLPMFFLISAAIIVSRNGPVIYTSKRVGLNGRIFRAYKFRTMVVDADKMGPGVTCARDRRITRLGWLLRKYKLDEFPLLVNVVLGDMNLVGPRPEDPRYTGTYDEHQQSIFDIRPGITSPASLHYRDECSLLSGEDWEDRYLTEILPAKLRIDIKYFQGNTFASDLRVMARTISIGFQDRALRSAFGLASIVNHF